MNNSNGENLGKKALKAGIGYTAGNVLVKGLSFVSVFIFARMLTVSDFGIFSAYSADASILFVVIGFALHACLKNANIDYHERIDEFSSSVTLPTVFNAAFLLVISLLFSKQLAALLKFDRSAMIVLIVVESFCMAMITYYNSILSIDYRYKEYLWISLIYSVVGIGLSVLLIQFVFPGERYLGRVLGTLISSVIVTAYIFARVYRKAVPKICTEYWRYALKISLPIVPHGLSQILLSSFDRLMIKARIGDESAGLYSFAYTVGTIYSVVAASLDTAWSQWFFDQMEAKKTDEIRKVATIYGTIMSAGAIMLLLISPELVSLMGGDKYFNSRAVTPPVILAMYFAFMYFFPASIEYYYKKTKMIAIGTISAAVLNIILNAVFIPLYGYVAAAYTTVACYVCYYILHVVFSSRVHGSALFDMKKQALMIALVSVVTILVLVLLNSVWIRLGLFLVLIIIGTALVLRYKMDLLGFVRKLKE